MLLKTNTTYVYVRLINGKETTVSLSHLTPKKNNICRSTAAFWNRWYEPPGGGQLLTQDITEHNQREEENCQILKQL